MIPLHTILKSIDLVLDKNGRPTRKQWVKIMDLAHQIEDSDHLQNINDYTKALKEFSAGSLFEQVSKDDGVLLGFLEKRVDQSDFGIIPELFRANIKRRFNESNS